MSKDALSAACKDYLYWAKELNKTEAYRKLKVLENFILGYGGTLPDVNLNPIPSDAPLAQVTNMSKRKRIESLCAEAINANGGFCSTIKIHEYFMAKGFEIKQATLAWNLSTSDMFVPDRKKGWSLK